MMAPGVHRSRPLENRRSRASGSAQARLHLLKLPRCDAHLQHNASRAMTAKGESEVKLQAPTSKACSQGNNLGCIATRIQRNISSQ